MKISRVMLAAALCGASLYPIPSLIAPVMAQAAPAASSKAADAAVRTIPGRPQFPEKMAGKVNRRAMDSVKWRLAPAYEEPMLEAEAAADTITIMGAAEASEEQMVHYIEKRNPQPKLNCSVEDIVRYYYEEAGREGIRPDVALCQALKETGFFAYGGDVSPKQNNFCGLGATGNREPGASFATPQLGVRAHIQHLMAYATQERPHGAIVDPRYKHVVVNRPDIHGHITKWTGLNGVWAVPGTRYGQEILYLWQQAQAPDGSDASLAAAEKKVRQMPDEAGSYIYRGIVYFNRAAYKEAQADFKQAAGLKPDSMAAHYNLAITQQREGDHKAALKSYDALLKLSPEFMQAWYNRGFLALEQKKETEALADFQEALRLTPQTADAKNAQAVAYIRQKDYAKAWQALGEAADINSANMNVLANQFIFEACLK
ncbi:tetratricopeptide repeat protein [Mitsuokella sp. UBA4253]|uniref:tetratricopeptide repeat protein n=1 Tax=Mitsuokella sp. UBA4253 TaxID=1946959 RepID=UPI00257B4057|nr:tetratricopeptide repeat protein [Mitsuokella sp. UBA4253]